MKFLADEGIEGLIVEHFRQEGYDIKYIVEMERGIGDDEVLSIARQEDRILITRDKDFGELVYMLKKLHAGIILNRLAGLPTSKKAEIVLQVIKTYSEELYGSFTVIQPGTVRIKNLKK